MSKNKYLVEVKIKQYLYDDPKSDHYSVELSGPSFTIVFGNFKSHKSALKFSKKFSLQKPTGKTKVNVTDFRGGETLEELMKRAA